MGASQPARRGAARNPFDQFFSDAGNRVDQFRRQAETVGRAVYDASIKAGKPVVAQTTAQLVELGARAIRAEVNGARAIATVAKNPTSPQAKKILHEAGAQAMALAHGAGDAISMGAADHVSAGIRAAITSGGDLHRVRELYDRNIAQERAQDAYEGEHYGAARMAGQIGGTAASLLIPLGEVAQVARLTNAARAVAGARLAPAVARATEFARPLTSQTMKLAKQYLGEVPRTVKAGDEVAQMASMKLGEHAALAGAGAVSNVVGQGVSDLTSGRKSTWRDYAVAAGVGAVQGRFAHRYGPGILGATGGAATSAGQDFVDGRPVSALDAVDAVIAGGAGGVGGHFAGRSAEGWVNGLPNNAKRIGFLPPSRGELGERLMRIRTRLRGESAAQGSHRLRLNDLLSEEQILAGHNGFGDRYTVPDEYILNGVAEAKFGKNGELTQNQIEARNLLGHDRYRVDNFQARDLGVMVGLPVAQMTAGEARNAIDILDRRSDVPYRRAPTAVPFLF